MRFIQYIAYKHFLEQGRSPELFGFTYTFYILSMLMLPLIRFFKPFSGILAEQIQVNITPGIFAVLFILITAALNYFLLWRRFDFVQLESRFLERLPPTGYRSLVLFLLPFIILCGSATVLVVLFGGTILRYTTGGMVHWVLSVIG